MSLRGLIGSIGSKYDRTLPMGSEAQRLLRGADAEMEQWVPAGYKCMGSGGKGNASSCPWIAVLDPDETDTPRRGMYVVYLFAEDLSTVALTLNQGVSEVREARGAKTARDLLRRQAEAIRGVFDPATIVDLEGTIDLRTKATLPVDYEYGNILARTYRLDALPDEAVMVADLQRFIRLYAAALRGREQARQAGDEAIVTTTGVRPARQHAAEFKPKDDSDYRQSIAARELIKTRRHETVVRLFGDFLHERRGFEVATNVHPRDLTAECVGAHWLIEVKTVQAGNGVDAARAALAQLLSYRYFLYEPDAVVNMLAVFSESVGAACVALLEHHGIAVVWSDGKDWRGSKLAVDGGVC